MDNQNSPAAPVNNNPLANDLPVSEVVSALKNAPPTPPTVTTTTTISSAPIDITPASTTPPVPSMTSLPVPTQTPVTTGPEPTVPTNNPVMPPVPAAPVAPSEPAKESVNPLYENPDLVKVPGS